MDPGGSARFLGFGKLRPLLPKRASKMAFLLQFPKEALQPVAPTRRQRHLPETVPARSLLISLAPPFPVSGAAILLGVILLYRLHQTVNGDRRFLSPPRAALVSAASSPQPLALVPQTQLPLLPEDRFVSFLRPPFVFAAHWQVNGFCEHRFSSLTCRSVKILTDLVPQRWPGGRERRPPSGLHDG